MNKIAFALILLGACASREITQKNQAASHEFARSLEVGMTKEDFKRAGTEVGNCRGSEKALEECQVLYWVKSRPSLVVMPDVSDYSNESYDIYTLYFDHGQLQRWVKKVKSETSGYNRPEPVQ